MPTLYDRYKANPLSAFGGLYRDTGEDSTGRVSQCSGLYLDKEGMFTLYLSDLLTGKLDDRYIPKERLKDFDVLTLDDLNEEETQALNQKAEIYAKMCQAFAKFARDPNAGKGPEHFR